MAARSRTCSKCPTKIEKSSRTGMCRKCFEATTYIPAAPIQTPEAQVQEDREKVKLKSELGDYKTKYTEALKLIEAQEHQLGWLTAIREGVDTTYRITPREGLGTSEVTPIILASDWHSEEIVKPASVNGLNEFNLDIFDLRCEKFWQGALRLIRMFNNDVKITTVVLGLLGDFITGQIHGAENAENNALTPIEAVIRVQNKIIAGIDFLLNHSSYEFVVVCKVGNHSRTTLKVRSASENGHSLESMMYVHLAAYYRNEPRMKFVIDDGYFTYVDIYSTVNRFHHGHAIQYQGGVGGLYIPAKKAVAQWNKARRADRDYFGHFHQHLNDTDFTCNGSLIGYNSFGLRIKGSFEVPQQALVMVDKKRGYTGKWPILLT
jgi:hypothetical protein